MARHLFQGSPRGAAPAAQPAAKGSPRRTPGNSVLTARNAIKLALAGAALTLAASYGPRACNTLDRPSSDINTADGVERGRERMWTEGELLNHRSHLAEELTRYIRTYEDLPAAGRTFDVAKLAEINNLLIGRGTPDPARPGAINFTIEPAIRDHIQSLVTLPIPPEAVDGSLGNMKTALAHANQAYAIAALRCFENAAGPGAVVNNNWSTYFARRETTPDPSNITLPRYAGHLVVALYRSDHAEQAAQLARWLLASNIWQTYRTEQPDAARIVELFITLRNLQRPTGDAGTAPTDDAGTPPTPSDAGPAPADDAAVTPVAPSDAGPAQADDVPAPSDPAVNSGHVVFDPSTATRL